jgi:hypothetical protein
MKKRPIGIWILLIMYIFVDIALFKNMISTKIIQYGPLILDGIVALILSILQALIISAIVFGLFKARIWAKKLIILYQGFGIVNITLVFFGYFLFKDKYLESYNSLMQKVYPTMAPFTESTLLNTLLIATIPGIILSLLIIIYVIRKSDYFKE